jgi:hypothetical protein
MGALNDMEGEETGNFNVLFAKKFMALDATIDELYMRQGIMRDGGSLQSEATDPVTGEPLFYISSSGILKAIRALFHSITITGDSFFEGDILSGPLELNNRNPANIIETKKWAKGTSTQQLYAYIQTITGTTPVDGLYGTLGFNYIEVGRMSKDEIVCWLYDKDRNSLGGGSYGIAFNITDNYGRYVALLDDIQIGFYNPSGRTVKLNNLPRNEPTMQGAIWCDSQGYLRIKM